MPAVWLLLVVSAVGIAAGSADNTATCSGGAAACAAAPGASRYAAPTRVTLPPVPYIVVLLEASTGRRATRMLEAMQRRLVRDLHAHRDKRNVVGVIASASDPGATAGVFTWDDLFTVGWAPTEAQRIASSQATERESTAEATPALRVLRALSAVLLQPALQGPLALNHADDVTLIYVAATDATDGDAVASEADAHAVLGPLLPALTVNVSIALVMADGTTPPADWRTYLGAAEYEDAYANGAGFNRALTLRTIVATSDAAANTLQAHALSAGLALRMLPHPFWATTPESMATVALPIPEHQSLLPLPAALQADGTLPLMLEGEGDVDADTHGQESGEPSRWSQRLVRRRVAVMVSRREHHGI